MRKCRKMISWIMLTVMLATMTPYQALATEVPADSSVQEVQPAAGEEGQEQGQDTEGTIPEGQKDPEENEKTTPTEDPSGVTPGTSAVENDSTDDIGTDNSGTDNSGTDNSSTDAAIVNENPENGGSGNSGLPSQEIAAPEEPGSGSSTVPAQEEKKVELHEGSVEAEAGGFTVKAEGMLPEGAELVLTKLSDSTVEEVGKGLDKENQTAVFAYDVTIKDAEGKIWQPEELGVKISISGLNLENKAEVSVAHILDKEEAVEAAVSNNSVKAEEVSLSSGAAEELKAAVEAAGNGDSVIVTTITEDAGLNVKDDAVSFDVDSFSAIIVFTVDFTYEEYTYSIAGKESILLSELFAALNIEQDMSAVTSVEWEVRDGYNPNELISIEKQEGDWKLTSLKAFDTKEILIVTADNGKVYKIEVTDAAGDPGLTYEWDIEWGNAADGTNVEYEDDGTLVFHPYDWNYVVAEITVRLTVNVQDENARIPAYGVKYVIPKSVFKGWNGSSVDIMATQLTQTPETATQSDFIYSIEGDNIVITNFSPLAATSFEATFSYKAECLDVNGGHPDSVENDQTSSSVWWNNYTDYFTNEISPTFSIDLDDDGTPEEESTKNIDLAMMTRAGGQALIYTQPDNFNGVYLGWQDTWGTRPDDADDYFYIMWNFAYGRLSSDRDTQPWKVDISVDEAQNKLVFGDQEFQGELVGIKSTHAGVQGQPFYGYPGYKRSYYNHNQLVENIDSGYTNISTLNQTTGRFAFSKYTTLGYSYPNTSTPTSGYIFQGGVQPLSKKYVGTDYYCAQHFAVLMKYPMAFLQAARDGGVDLDIDGIKANSTMKMTETWDSGYTKTTDVNSYGADIHVRFGQGGSFVKWGREVDTVSSSHREIAGAQTYLLNGQDAQLGYATSAGGSYRASWQNRFSGRSKTENDLICGQHIVMEDKDIFLHAGQGNYTNSWAPSTSLKAWLKEGDYEFHGFWVSTFNEFEGIYAGETWSREAIASKEYEKYKPIYIYTSTSLDGEYQPYCVVDKSSGTIKVNLWDGTNVGEALARSWGHYALPEDTVKIKAEHDSEFYQTQLYLEVGVTLHPTDTVLNIVQSDVDHGTYTCVKNATTVEVSALKGTQQGEVLRTFTNRGSTRNDAATYEILRLYSETATTTVAKDAYVPDDSNAQQHQAGLQAKEIAYVHLDAHNATSISHELAGATNHEDPYKLLSGTFYELLPTGTTIQKGSLIGFYEQVNQTASWSLSASSYYSVKNKTLSTSAYNKRSYYLKPEDFDFHTEIDPETGQTMLIIDYTINDPNAGSYGEGTWSSDIHFFFIMENTYENIQTYGTSTVNALGFVNRTPGNGAVPSASQSLTNAKLGDLEPAFREVALEYPTSSVFNKRTIAWNNVTVLQAGFSKSAFAPESVKSIPQAEAYNGDAEVTVGNTYKYRLKLTMESNTKGTDIVFYDILESGMVDTESKWKGQLLSIDTSLIEDKKNDGGTANCAPVIYYSTTLTDKNSLTGTYFDLSDTSKWTTEAPEDLSTVTAIAIDCSKDTEGNQYILGNDMSLYAFITMQAPDELPEGYQEGDAADNGAVTVLDMFEAQPSGRHDKLISQAIVTLKDIDLELSKSSDPETGTSDAPKIVPGDGSGTIDYTLEIANNGTYDYRDVKVEDTIPAGLTISEIKVALNGGEEKDIDDLTAVTYEADEEDPNHLTFTIAQQHPGEDCKTRIIIKTTVDALKSVVTKKYDNTAEILGANDVVFDEPVTSETTYHQADAVEATAEKKWKNADGTTTAPAGASVTFTLYIDGEESDYSVTLDGTPETRADSTSVAGYESAAWKASFVNLPKYTFTTDEDTGEVTTEEIVYTVAETETYGGYNASTTEPVASGGSVTNTQDVTTADAQKAWKNADGTTTAPEGASVTFTLYADGTATNTTVTLDGTAETTVPTVTGGYESAAWKATFVNLPKYQPGTTTQIVYTVAETATYGGYKASTEESVASGSTITNTQEVTTADALKAWKNADGTTTAPEGASVTFTLYADGTATNTTVTLDGTAETTVPTVTGGYESAEWKATFVNLPKYQPGTTTQIVYTVAETTGYIGYTASTTEAVASGETITNSQDTTTADATKIWSNADGSATAPAGAKVTFTLYKDGEETNYTVELDGTPETTAPTVTGGYESAAWKATFVNLPKYQTGTDTEVEYTIAETSGCTGYTASTTEPVASGGSITNTQDVTSLKVIKVWEDAGDQDGKRPETITVKLLDGKKEITSQDIAIDRDTDRYEYTFTNLPIYVTDEEGVQHKAEYNVAEVDITTGDYSATYKTINAEGTKEKAIEIQITNSYTPEKTSVTVNKLWDDANDQDAMRPESIQVQLYNGDTAVREPVTLTAEDEWTYTWTELDKYSPHGQKITYSVKEVEPVPEYEAEILEIDDTNKIIINNKHEVHKTEVTVSKVWEDNDNKTGARPAELLVTLYADGEAVEETALNEKNSWKHTFENLDVNKIVDGKGGNAIVYTVEEEKVDAYYGEITKTEEEKGITYTIKNTYAPAKHDPPVKKVITGDKPDEAETFHFTITAVSNTAGLDEMPMPEGSSGSSKTTEVIGEGETEFGIITFDAPGQYIYKVVETAGSNSNYTYDKSTFQIIYDVTEGEEELQASIKYLKDGKEVDGIVFTNEYKKPSQPDEPSNPSKPSKPSRSNNTGDSANGALWALMLLLAGGALAGTIWFRRRKKI